MRLNTGMVITFTQDFDWCVGNTIIAYLAGHVLDVSPDCAETAIELGRAYASDDLDLTVEPLDLDEEVDD